MKDRIMMLAVAGGLVLAGFSLTATGEAEQVVAEDALETTQAATTEALETAEQAAESAEEAIETVEEMGEELQAAGDEIQDAAAELEAPGENPQPGMHEMMAAWMKMASPNEQHAKLDPFVGQWDVSVKFWMVPGMPPEINTGTSEIKWILDGRFIQENFQSVMQMGADRMTFKGFGLTGYDNAKQQFVGIWADTMSTLIVPSVGQFDESIGGFVFSSEFDDPMTGQPTSMRVVYKMVSDDEALMEAYKPVGELEFKCMEITYTRKQ